MESLDARDKAERPVGETLPLDHRAFRVEIMTNFLREGIPIAKLDGLRPIMERNNFSLTRSSHTVEYIPFILSEEKARLQSLLRDKNIGIIFDGTTRLGEAIAIVFRFLDGWTVRQVLVRLRTVAKPVTGQDLAKVINRCLALEYQIDGERVVAAMRDGASVNGVAIRTFQVLCPNVFDVTCFSHAANNAGHHFQFPVLEKFIRLWVQLFSHSSKAKLAWNQRTSFSIKSYSETRWWSLWEVMHQAFTCFGDVKPFLEELDGVAPHTVRQLLEIVNDEDDYDSLRLQLAAMVDVAGMSSTSHRSSKVMVPWYSPPTRFFSQPVKHLPKNTGQMSELFVKQFLMQTRMSMLDSWKETRCKVLGQLSTGSSGSSMWTWVTSLLYFAVPATLIP